MASDLLLSRLERFYCHSGPGDVVLSPGYEGIACLNIRRTLSMLGYDLPVEGEEFDETLHAAVRCFQIDIKHRVSDGMVGPGTRRKLVLALLARNDNNPEVFLRLKDPVAHEGASVFISYSSKDTAAVNKLDQWLRDHGIRVLRDRSWFAAGTSIKDNIRKAVSLADKVIAIYSQNSRDRDWPRFERAIAEEMEIHTRSPVLIYLNLDGTELPEHDAHRLAVMAKGRPLKEVGAELLKAISEGTIEPPQCPYDENEPL